MPSVYVLLLRSSKLSVDIAKWESLCLPYVQSPVQKKLINKNKDIYMSSFFPLLLIFLLLFFLSLSLCTSLFLSPYYMHL